MLSERTAADNKYRVAITNPHLLKRLSGLANTVDRKRTRLCRASQNRVFDAMPLEVNGSIRVKERYGDNPKRAAPLT